MFGDRHYTSKKGVIAFLFAKSLKIKVFYRNSGVSFDTTNKIQEVKKMEKLYQKLNSIGVSSLIVGIITIVVGIGLGVVMIVNGARSLGGKHDIIF